MSVKLLTKPHMEFLSLNGGCTGSSESTLVKMPHCWKSHVAAHMNSENRVNTLSAIRATALRLMLNMHFGPPMQRTVWILMNSKRFFVGQFY